MKALQDSELRYRRLFEAAQDGVLILDAETGMIEDVNPYLINMLGYSREEFIKKKLWEVGAFRDVESSKDAFEALQANEYIRYEDLPLKTKDGRLIQVEFVSNVYLAGEEKVIQCNIRDITEHKRLLAALQENEKKYYDLVNQSPDGIFIIETSGEILTVNKVMCKELGFSKEEFLSMNIWEIIPQQYLEQYRQRLTKILEGKSWDESAEYEVHGKDGQIHYVEVLTTPHYKGKAIIGFQGTARDITARKWAETALQASEARYRRLFEAAQDGVLILDAWTGMIEDVNPYLINMLGYSREEFIKKKLWEVGAFRDIEASKDAFEALQENEYIRYEDLPLKTKDGRLIQVEFVSNVYLVGSEKVIQCNIRDITERKRVEDMRAKLAAIVESSDDAIMSETLDGIITSWNLGAQKVYDYSAAEAIGQSVSILMPPDRPNELVEILSRLKQGEKVEHFETVRIKKNGGMLDVSITISPIKDAAGRMVGYSTITRDITERKQAEERLLSAHEFLQSVQDALSAHITILDYEGNIVQVNSAWRDFGAQNGLLHSDHCIGMNYLDICDSAKGPYAEEAPLVANAIRTIRTDGKGEKWIEYPCHAPDRQRWFIAKITSFENNEQKWIVVAHENITERKKAEEKIKRQLEHLTALSAIDRVIASNFDLKLSLSEILNHVTMELEVDAADILILNSNSNMLEYGAERGFRTKAARKAQIRLGESYAGRAALNRQLVQIPNLRDEPDNLLLTTLLLGEDFVCYYGVPLITKGQVKGVLEVFHRTALEPDEEWFDFLKALAGQTAIAIENATLFESVQRSSLDLSLAYDATIEGWSHALDLRDKETEGHTQRVTEMAVNLARANGLSEAELVQVRWGALLHDIGKMGVPDRILLKPGPLSDEEWVAMKKHPTFAYELLSPVRYLRLALDIPYCHHEKWDGTGYPRGLKGDQIPLVARIFAVVDVWDALTSDRPYRTAWTKEKAREHIRAESGTHFDPQVVAEFMQIPD
jgi:PAS domain S-box-containing protein